MWHDQHDTWTQKKVSNERLLVYSDNSGSFKNPLPASVKPKVVTKRKLKRFVLTARVGNFQK